MAHRLHDEYRAREIILNSVRESKSVLWLSENPLAVDLTRRDEPMDPLDFFKDEQLLNFLHRNKTEISVLEKPHVFLNQLRDHNLIPETTYKKVSRMKSKDNLKNGLYETLNWLETNRAEHIKLFWSCVFKDSILNHYPTLRLLRNSLMDGSYQVNESLPEVVVEEEPQERKSKKTSGEGEEVGEEKVTGGKRKRKMKNLRDEEQPCPSSKPTPRKKSLKHSYSPLRKGEKADIWNWAIYKTQLPVTCGDQSGQLHRNKLAQGEECIQVGKQWYTPAAFEKLAGRQSFKNWRQSIRCRDVTLGALILDGHLKTPGYMKRKQSPKVKKSLFPSEGFDPDSDKDEEDEDQDEDQDIEDEASAREKGSTSESSANGSMDSCKEIWLPVFLLDEEEGEPEDGSAGSLGSGGDTVFRVTCGAISADLHKDRFASGTCGKSIRTETSWLTPVEFVKQGSAQPDACWRRDIRWKGKPLYELLRTNVLRIHSLLCKCGLCDQQPSHLDDQKNDDWCFICRRDGCLVVCEGCPRAFHQKCHLPNIDDALLGDNTQWNCTFCVFKLSLSWRYPSQMTLETAMALRISSRLLECQYLLLFLYNADENQTFVTDPSHVVEGYTAVIKTPMWLDKVTEKLQQNHFRTVKEFVSDILLIFTNCKTFNRDNAEILDIGDRLKNLFEMEFKNVFVNPDISLTTRT